MKPHYDLHRTPTPFEREVLRRLAAGEDVVGSARPGYRRFIKAAVTRLFNRGLTISVGGQPTAAGQSLLSKEKP